MNTDLFEVLDYRNGRFCQVSQLKDRESSFSWGVINAYGPVQLDLKPDFLRELMEMIVTLELPVVVGGF